MIFSSFCNVLSNINSVREFPFPHAGTSKCLPHDIYNDLAQTRPAWGVILCGRELKNNVRYDAKATDLLKSNVLSPVWREFISYHVSKNFYHSILDRYENYFTEFYPHLKNMREYKVGTRFDGSDCDIFLDCQISVNTPVTQKSSVRRAHVDNPLSLWASMLYMREPDDYAGGDLILYKCTDMPNFMPKRCVESHVIRPWARVDYAPNSYISFMNSPFSVHSVTEREVTDKARLMVNITLEFSKKGQELFKV